MAPPSVGTWFAAVDQGDIATIRAAASECASLRDENGETALMRAVRSDNYDAVKVLLHNGSGFTNSDGLTALMIAAIVNKARCCRALVAKESHLILPDGRTPLMLAAQNGSLDAAKALMPYYVTKVDSRGRTALMYAAARGDLSIVEILHARECKFSSSEHETALSIAIMHHHHDVVEFLRSSEEDTMAMLSESARLSMSRRTDLDASLVPSNLLNHSTASQDSSTSDLIMSQADLSERLETTKAIALSELNTMNLELKTRIGKLHEDASELMSRNANLQVENKRLHERIQELLRHNQELKLELDDERRCHQDTAEQVKELTDMTQTLRDLQSNNMLSESQADFGQRYGALELSIAPDPPGAPTESLEKNDEIAALKMKIAALPAHDSSELSERLAREVEEKDRIIDDLKKQLSEQIDAYKTLNATIEELRGRICSADNQFSPSDKIETGADEHSMTKEAHSQSPTDPNVRIHDLESKLQSQSNDADKFMWTEERENLAGLLTALSAERDNLQEENEMLRNRVQILEAEAEAQEQEVKELRHQIHDQKSKLRELAEELDECRALNEDLQKSVNGEPAGDEGRIAALESRNEELLSQLVARTAEVDALKNELTTQVELVHDRISCLEADNAELHRCVSHLDDVKNAYEQELKELREVSLAAAADRAEHEEEVALFEAEVKNLHNVNRLQAHEIHALQREIDGLTSANDDLRASVSGAPSGDDARVYALEERLSALQKEAAFKTQEIADLQRTVGELGDSSFLLERMKEEAARHEKEIAKLRDRLAARDQDVQDLEQECAGARARIRALEEEVPDSQVQDLTAELEARTAEIDELRRLIDDSTVDKKSDVDTEELRKDLAHVTAERDSLRDEVSKLNKTIIDLEQSLDAINAQVSTSDADISRLNDELSTLKDQLSSKCLELEEANSKIDLLKAELEEKTIESASSNPDLSSIPSLARSTSRSTQNLGELSLDELRELLDSERRRIKKLNNKITALMTEKNILNDQINAMKTSSAKNLPLPAAPVLEEPSLATGTDDVRISDLEQALKDANERADAKERELTDALQRIENLGAQISPLEAELSSLQDRLSATGEVIEKLRAENQQLNKQIAAGAQSEELITSLTRELEGLRTENSQLNAVKEDLKRQIEDKVKELAIERQQAETLKLSQRIPDKIASEYSDHVEKPRSVNESDDVMERADRCINFVAGMCVGASMVFGAQFLQTVIH